MFQIYNLQKKFTSMWSTDNVVTFHPDNKLLCHINICTAISGNIYGIKNITIIFIFI
jgi:hypothetical protein